MERFILFCFRSCLKGDGEKDYYDVLDLDPTSKITPEIVKRQYKKLSLTLHPDKLAQRGEEVTQEHKVRFLKLKEAYAVLSDPKRKRLYDEYGESGLKLLENPAEMNHLELLRNFQRNRGDRTALGLLIAFIFACLFLLPVLFSLKSDGTLGNNAPWVAIWSPMWFVDIILLLMAGMVLSSQKKKKGLDDEEEETVTDDEMTITQKLVYVINTLAFIVLQVFVTMRIDRYLDWTWFAVFIPWYVYDATTILSHLQLAFFTTVEPPNHENIGLNVEEGGGDDDVFMQKMTLETQYFEKVMEVQRAQKTIVTVSLRLWQSFFLAAQLDNGYNWSWGVVFLPIWVYLFLNYVYMFILRTWGYGKLNGLDSEAILSGNETDPVVLMRYQQGNELVAFSSLICFSTLAPLFMSIMLVCRLETSDYSTFLIILPVFIVLGCSCCVVFCGLCCLSTLDMEGLEEEMHKAQRGGGEAGGDEEGVEAGYHPPEPVVVAPSAGGEGGAYGTFEKTGDGEHSPLQESVSGKLRSASEAKRDEEAQQASQKESSQKESAALAATGIDLDID